MSYRCSVCHKEVEGDLLIFMSHTKEHIVDAIKSAHPDWVEKDGICKKCVEYFERQIKGKH